MSVRAVATATVLALMLWNGAARAECRLALALAFDVSRSVSARDYIIQRDGLLAALADPAVVSAFLSPGEPVAFALYEWSHSVQQTMVVDWVLVRSPADLAALRGLILHHERSGTAGTTALGAALRFGRGLMERAPPCADWVIDISGDGQNNSGVDPALVYAAGFGDIRVNGLAIRSYERDVAAYYREQVIRGPGAFVEVADTFADFPRAIRRKLIRELTERIIGEGVTTDHPAEGSAG
jgi:hypothetical protein